MLYLVSVKFLPGGALSPEEFFHRINARWSWLEYHDETEPAAEDGPDAEESPRAAVCIADLESIEQLSIDLAIVPCAGISNIEVFPMTEEALKDLQLQIR